MTSILKLILILDTILALVDIGIGSCNAALALALALIFGSLVLALVFA